MGNNVKKYSDITLMRFSDGELDKATSKQLEKDLVDDKELQDRLNIYTSTRDALLDLDFHQHSEIPKHISDLIDNFQVPKKTNRVIEFLKNYPASSITASLSLGIFIGMQSFMVTQLTRGIDDITKSVPSISFEQKKKEIYLKAMLNYPESEYNSDFPKITIISTFKNSRKQSCKLAEIQNSYLIFCQNKDGFWEVSLDFTNNQQD